MHRRHFNLHLMVPLAVGPSVVACSEGSAALSYEDAVRNTWRTGSSVPSNMGALQLELVRYATLAPSSHNTQCWQFKLGANGNPNAIDIRPDLSRRCPAVDPDDHHLFVSLGCATENMVHAALAHGLHAEPVFDPSSNNTQVLLTATTAQPTAMFHAITERQCTRAEYDGKPLTSQELSQLQEAGNGAGVRVLLLTDKPSMEKTLDYVVQGNTAQINDPAFVRELKAWIRFSASDAVRHGDGLYAASSGNPSLPAWLGERMFGVFFTPKNENDKYAKQLRSSAGVAVFVADVADHAHWLEVGRCYERFALQATAMGIRNAMINQPVEVPTLRPGFANALNLGPHRADLVVRFGRGPKLPASLRRPVQSVLV
jgi:hypothetical protein